MIRTMAFTLALAAVPMVAAAQSDTGSLTIHGRPTDSYSMAIDVRGKSVRQVRQEIWDAAHTVCERAPLTGDATELTVDNWISCVNAAMTNADQDYDRMIGR